MRIAVIPHAPDVIGPGCGTRSLDANRAVGHKFLVGGARFRPFYGRRDLRAGDEREGDSDAKQPEMTPHSSLQPAGRSLSANLRHSKGEAALMGRAIWPRARHAASRRGR